MTGRRERKVVTVLFADLAGFTSRAEAMDPEDVAALLDPYQARLKSELERFGAGEPIAENPAPGHAKWSVFVHLRGGTRRRARTRRMQDFFSSALCT